MYGKKEGKFFNKRIRKRGKMEPNTSLFDFIYIGWQSAELKSEFFSTFMKSAIHLPPF
jgi:hypothetical protein